MSGAAPLAAFVRQHARAIGSAMLSAAVAIAAGIWAGPWVMPLRIVEGPYLQATTETGSTVLWWTTRPARCELVVRIDGAERVLSPTADRRCSRVRIDGLTADASYAYVIRCGGRTLAEGTLHTNPPAATGFTFVVFGDSGRGSKEQFRIAAQVAAQHPDFILHTGDLVYPAGDREDYRDRFFAPYAPLLGEINFWPCMGNHDIDNETRAAPPYRAVFELPENGPPGLTPEHHYWFDFGNARVAVFDSNLPEAELREHIAPWLTQVFADAGERWRFVSFHHPPHTVGKYAPDARILAAIVPQLEASGVDVVFSGHDHMYARTLPLLGGQPAADGADGIIYIVSGAGGARLYREKSPTQRPKWFAALNDRVHSFTCIDVTGDTLHARQIGLTGELLDEWTCVRRPTPASGPATRP